MAFPSRKNLESDGDLDPNTRASTERVGCQLYVSDIPSRFNENGLANLFGKYGRVLNISYHQRHARAFVNYSRYGEAVYAMQDLHNKPPLSLQIDFAKEKKENMATKEYMWSNNMQWNTGHAEYPEPVSSKGDIKKSSPTNLQKEDACDNRPVKYNLGRGQQLAALVCKDSPRQTDVPLSESDEDLLYPIIQDQNFYNPYETDELYNSTNNVLIRACVGVSSDGTRHVSKGRGYTFHTLAETDLKVPQQVGRVRENRQSGMYVYGENKLASEVGKCQHCSQPATMHCQLCNGFYCGKECQTADWPRHKNKCQADKNPAALESQKTTENLAKSKASSNTQLEHSKPIAWSPNAVNLLRISQRGYFEAHVILNSCKVSGTICFDTIGAEFHKVMFQLPAACEALPKDHNFKPKFGEFICGQRENNDWIRGHVVSLGPPVRLAIMDEGRVESVKQISALPKEFASIPTFGVSCELLQGQLQLKPWNKYLFKVTQSKRSEDQEGIEVLLSPHDKVDTCEEFKGILRPWIPAAEQKGLPYARLTSGTEICLTAYQSHEILFARSLAHQDFERFNRIMQKTAACALYAPHLTEIPVVGQMVLAKFPKDGNFYRAIVRQIENDVVTVSYVDYGNTEAVKLEDLKSISDELKQHPSCIAKILLKDVPRGVVMTKEVNDFLSLLVGRGQPLKCTFDDEPTINGISLKLQNGESVNEKVNLLLKPSWKREEIEDQLYRSIFSMFGMKDITVYMWFNMDVASLGKKGCTVTVRVLSTVCVGVRYMLCPQDIDLIQHVAVVMTDQINEYCKATTDHYIPRVHELCLAPFEGIYYRAVCLESKATMNSSLVLFIDFGNTEQVAHVDMKRITKDFTTIESLASICSVTALGPVNEEGFLSEEITARVKELIPEEGVVRVKIVKCVHPGDYDVELPDVRDTLIKEGLIEP